METNQNPNVPLIPQLQRLKDQIAGIKQGVAELTSGLSNSQMNWSPAPDQWSIALCLDHLNKVGYLLLPCFDKAIEQLHTRNLHSDGPFRYGLLERLFIRILSPNPPIKVPVPSIYVPTAVEDPLGTIVPDFIQLQDWLIQRLIAANGLDLKRVKVVSPVNRYMSFSLGAWFEGIVAHEQYHWLQAQAIRSNPDFP